MNNTVVANNIVLKNNGGKNMKTQMVAKNGVVVKGKDLGMLENLDEVVKGKIENKFGGNTMENKIVNMNLSQEAQKVYGEIRGLVEISYMEAKHRFGSETKELLDEMVEAGLLNKVGVDYAVVHAPRAERSVAKAPQRTEERIVHTNSQTGPRPERQLLGKGQGVVESLNSEKNVGVVRNVDGKAHVFFLDTNKDVYKGMKVAFDIYEGKAGKDPIASALKADDTVPEVPEHVKQEAQKKAVVIQFKNTFKKLAGGNTPEGKFVVPFEKIDGFINIGDKVEIEYVRKPDGFNVTLGARMIKKATPYKKGVSKSPAVSNLNAAIKAEEVQKKKEFFQGLEARIATRSNPAPKAAVQEVNVAQPIVELKAEPKPAPANAEAKTPERVYTRFGWKSVAKAPEAQRVEEPKATVQVAKAPEPKIDSKVWAITNLQRTELKRELLSFYQNKYNGNRKVALGKFQVELGEHGDKAFEVLGITAESAKDVKPDIRAMAKELNVAAPKISVAFVEPVEGPVRV